jgi:proline iminopeptidase
LVVRVQVGDLRLFFDVDGLGLVPDGRTMEQRPTLLLLHGGPGFDHPPFKPRFSQLADVCQVGISTIEGRDEAPKRT